MPKVVTENKEVLYTIAFTATLNHSEISKSFYEFLREQKFYNNWDFILATHVLNSHMDKNNYNQAVDHMKYIMNTFFDSNIKPLQLKTQDEKNVFLKINSSWKIQQLTDTKQFLEQLKNLFLGYYKSNEFQQFLKTPIAEKLIKKNKKQKKTIVPILTQKFDYSDEDFEIDHITQKDLDFFEHISKEKQHTETLFKNEKYSLWLMNQNYFPNVSYLNNVSVIRSEYNFNCSFDQAAFSIFNNILDEDPDSTFFEIVDNKPKEKFIIEQHLIVAGLLPNIRKSIYTFNYKQDRIQMVCKPMRIEGADFHKQSTFNIVTKRNGKPKRMKATQEFFFASMELISIDQNRTKLAVSICLEIGTKIWMVPKRWIKHKFSETFNGFSKKMKNLSGMETIYDWESKFLNQENASKNDPIAKLLYDIYIEANGEKVKKKIENQPITTKNSNQISDPIIANIQDNINSQFSNTSVVEKRCEDILLKTISKNFSVQQTNPIMNQSSIFQSNFQFQPTNQLLDFTPKELLFDDGELFSPNFSFFNFPPSNETEMNQSQDSNEEILFKLESFEDLNVFESISEIDDLVSFLENERKSSTDSDIDLF